MQRVKYLESKEQQQFVTIANYCFIDGPEWTDTLFPTEKGVAALGYFAKPNILAGGLITRNFTSSLFNQTVPSNGIGCVISSPEARNAGHVRDLMIHSLQEAHKSGSLYSHLHPFSKPFYQRFGYGVIGRPQFYIFKPEDIQPMGEGGRLFPFSGSKKEAEAYYSIYNSWISAFDFGILNEEKSAAGLQKELTAQNERIYFYSGDNGDITGVIRFSFRKGNQGESILSISKIAWMDGNAFNGLFRFLWVHRSQVEEIHWNTTDLPLDSIFKKPRDIIKKERTWMARPLYVKKLLEMKAKVHICFSKIVFSLEDDIIPENTGTYRIEGGEVFQDEFNGENRIDMSVFSSLLFGELSLTDAKKIGLVPKSFAKGGEQFFRRNHEVFISELF